MRVLQFAVLFAAMAATAFGCNSREYSGPTVEKFTGTVTHNGKQITLKPEERLTIQMRHESGQTFGIPIQPDGTFEIGWMPLGHYDLIAERYKDGQRGGPSKTGAGTFQVMNGKTEYTIELGKSGKH
jgi:hypothetical protein